MEVVPRWPAFSDPVGAVSQMIPPDFGKLGARDMAVLAGVLIGLCIAGLVAYAGFLFVVRMMLGG